MQDRTTIFISYSHCDVFWKERLCTHLAALQDPTVEAWHDSLLKGGEDWLSAIETAIDRARVAIMLVSADFLASRFIREYEVPILLQHHALKGLWVYPLIVSSCAWRRIPWLGHFQARPLYAEPLADLSANKVESALAAVAREVQDMLSVETVPGLPPPGAMVVPTRDYSPPVLVGMKVFAPEPLRLKFVLASGDESLDLDAARGLAPELLSHFLTCVSVDASDLWVNMSPAEPDRVVSRGLGGTPMGSELLRQDYLLKQLYASITYPENEEAKALWDSVIEAGEGGSSPLNTFNKVWIVPNEATVWEGDFIALITNQRLAVLLEDDYKQLKLALATGEHDYGGVELDRALKTAIVDHLLPVVEREVNSGRTFAPLRQIYQSLILAHWYKGLIKRSALADDLVESCKVVATEKDGELSKAIMDQWIEAYRRGVFRFIHEHADRRTGAVTPRKHFSGGILASAVASCLQEGNAENLERAREVIGSLGSLYLIEVRLTPASGGQKGSAEGRGGKETVGGVDLGANLSIERGEGSSEVRLDSSHLYEVLQGNVHGLLPTITEVLPLHGIDELLA